MFSKRADELLFFSSDFFLKAVNISSNAAVLALALTVDTFAARVVPMLSLMSPLTRVCWLSVDISRSKRRERNGSQNQTSNPTRPFQLTEWASWNEHIVQLDEQESLTDHVVQLAGSASWNERTVQLAVDRTSCPSPSLDGSVPRFVAIGVTIGTLQ
ncbi:hypothetical protein F2Q69_00012785 [Brassica cretica]|uniref:Uncharacterized protein n=1 Tax=Brassica cretica TaxID=69181 RepID=A0A8S9R0T8_BRACR|nr:hypothetical protein F2Q69_00012785 [Brassica cretica]